MKINSRHYILIIFALTSVIVVSMGYAYIYKKTVTQANNYRDINKEVKNEDNRKKSEDELIKIYDATKEFRSKIPTFFVHENKIVDFIETVENIGSTSKTKLEISSISNDANNVKAKINIEGSWANTMTALILIENLPLSITIKNLRMNSTIDSIKKNSRIWLLTLDIEALIMK